MNTAPTPHRPDRRRRASARRRAAGRAEKRVARAGRWWPWSATARPPWNQALALKPDVVFLDIRMPGMTGLEAAAELADEWPADEAGAAFPALVFVTAYDEYALQAFEAQAMDYVLKPVQTERLARTAQRLQAALAQRDSTRPRPARPSPAMDDHPGPVARPARRAPKAGRAASRAAPGDPGQRGQQHPHGAGGRGAGV